MAVIGIIIILERRVMDIIITACFINEQSNACGIMINGATSIAGSVGIAGGLAVTPPVGSTISLGGAGGPLVGASNWEVPWSALAAVVAAQIPTYSAGPPTVSPADYLLLLNAINTVAQAFTATKTTKTLAE